MFFSTDSQQTKQQDTKIWLTGSYCRLSKEDEDTGIGVKDESNSIANQKALIRDYIDGHPEFVLVKEYADDGYSGVTFDRPQFQQMMEDVKNKKINCIIVKDLSRFGRNYIEVGKYLEQVFPFLGIRFIAITDGTDTGKKQSDAEQFVLPFKNLFNDSYCRDISTKVRSQLAIKRKNGKYVGNFACYGYLKDPADHNRLVIDPDTAPVIQQIFFWKINGLSAARIAGRLNDLGMLCPMEYKKSLGMKVNTRFRTNDKAQWAAQTIQRILRNEVYIGNMTQGRRTTPSYKVKKMIEKPQAEWDRVENTHEAIIHKDVFEVVQMLLMRDTRISPEAERLYLFGGFLCCADCGSNMVRRRRKHNEKVYAYYTCSGYKRKSGCTSHNISEQLLYDTVLNAVQQQCLQVLYLQRLLKYAQDLPDNPDGLHHYDVQLAQLDDEIRRSQEMKIKLVENLNAGIITREDYQELSPVYDTRIKNARKAKQNIEAEKEGLKEVNVDGGFIAAYKKYQNIETLDREVLAALIDYIEVYEDKRLVIHFKHNDEVERIQSYLASRIKEGEIASLDSASFARLEPSLDSDHDGSDPLKDDTEKGVG